MLPSNVTIVFLHFPLASTLVLWSWCLLGPTSGTRRQSTRTVTSRASSRANLTWRLPMKWQLKKRSSEQRGNRFPKTKKASMCRWRPFSLTHTQRRKSSSWFVSLLTQNIGCETCSSSMETSVYARSDPLTTTMTGRWYLSRWNLTAIRRAQAIQAWWTALPSLGLREMATA